MVFQTLKKKLTTKWFMTLWLSFSYSKTAGLKQTLKVWGLETLFLYSHTPMLYRKTNKTIYCIGWGGKSFRKRAESNYVYIKIKDQLNSKYHVYHIQFYLEGANNFSEYLKGQLKLTYDHEKTWFVRLLPIFDVYQICISLIFISSKNSGLLQ